MLFCDQPSFYYHTQTERSLNPRLGVRDEVYVDPTPGGDSIALVVRLHENANGNWCLHVEGTSMIDDLPLVPATLVVQLWRASGGRVLRGTIQLGGSSHMASIQSNLQLIELVHAWLMPSYGETECSQ